MPETEVIVVMTALGLVALGFAIGCWFTDWCNR